MFKDSAIGGVVLALETSDAIANYYGGQEVLKKNIDGPIELAKKLRAITAKDILREAKQIFREDNINLALIGPFESEESFAKILHI